MSDKIMVAINWLCWSALVGLLVSCIWMGLTPLIFKLLVSTILFWLGSAVGYSIANGYSL